MTDTTQARAAAAAAPGRLMSGLSVQGTPVYGAGGERLGEIRDLVLHRESGRIAYAIMAHGGFAGAGEKSHPLPWSILSHDAERGGYVVSLSRTDLEGAPAMAADEIGEHDESWRERVHTHFQAAPYWT